jgi:hypothetical protein
MRNPGKLIKLKDGRKVILYNNQPLIKSGRVVLHLIDDDYNIQTDETGKAKTILKNIEEWNEENRQGLHKGIGMVD